MKKFVLMYDINDSIGYGKYVLQSASNENALCEKCLNKLSKKIFSFHFSGKLNKNKELPLKKFWVNILLKKLHLDCKEEICFIFFEESKMAFSNSCLNYIKRKYCNSTNWLVLTNPLEEKTKNKLILVKNQYEKVVTFLKEDAEKNNLVYYPYGYPYYIPKQKSENKITSDVLFVGNAKGRYGRLIDIYEKLVKKGYICDFNIVGVEKEKQVYSNDICYNKLLRYDQVLEKVRSTKCVLEIVYDNYNYCTLRTLEAMLLKKKLITSNTQIKNLEIYNKKQVFIIDETNQIKDEFLSGEVLENEFPNEEIFSFLNFVNYIEK